MIAAKKARVQVTGHFLHMMLKLPEDVEILAATLELRGEGLPDDCEATEGSHPPFIGLQERDGVLVPIM